MRRGSVQARGARAPRPALRPSLPCAPRAPARLTRVPAGAGAHRLIRDGHALHLLLGHALEALGQLDSADLRVELQVVLLLSLADAQDRLQPVRKDLEHVFVHL